MAMVAPAVDARGDREPPVPTPSAATAHHLQTPNTAAFYDDLPYTTTNNDSINNNNTPARSYSVNAVPTDHHYQQHYHHQQQQQQQQQRSVQRNTHLSHDEDQQDPPVPWWQCYYQLYHYFPPAGRKPTVFGPYLLLHTLGEGEFGKVKLGVHVESSQEVAIKLIKKDHIDSSSRMCKVEREISVLRTVCHPYIVKLYDVIETEKYIGIILQCASGGELFEDILAHRYLKERDACRLFAQLISGVHYMHQKHIVHRDLKLENLLLDRDRNIIITDFGFANQFSSAKDDLMATSCGSPCYAAPELVVSEGMYVGSAVDIWSCGVILYAMLCGYLPFDDDPANPDGDNINLLYKYILNTSLAFPDYVSDAARDLLQKMLVPDPTKRCTMQTVMSHPWLDPHRALFSKSIAELEAEGMQSADLPVHQQQHKKDSEQQKSSNVPHPPSARVSEDARGTQDDQVVPEVKQDRMEVDKDEDDDLRVPSHNGSDSSMKSTSHSSQSDSPRESSTECSMKGTMAATADPSAVPDVSSFELPMSMHTDTSESNADKATLSDQPRANPDRKDAHKQNSPEPHPGKPDPHPPSILQAKFLSSIQRTPPQPQHSPSPQRHTSESQHHHAPYSAPQPRDNLMSMSTPQIPTPTATTNPTPQTRRQRSPSSALPPPRPIVPQQQQQQQQQQRGTRRKALSLLVNSVADHLEPNPSKKTMSFSRKGTRERAQSASHHTSTPHHHRYSGFKRVVTGKDRDTPRTSLHIMPSVSERTIADKNSSGHGSNRSAGTKLMDWFKKKPLSTRDRSLSSLGRPELNGSTHVFPSLHTALMPIGKSYAVDFNDTRLRTHHGAVDQDALTSRSPPAVLVEVKQTLLSMGMDIKKDGEYKLKCVRRKRPAEQLHDGSSSASNSSTTKQQRRTSAPFRMFLRGARQHHHNRNHRLQPSEGPTPTPTSSTPVQVIYGDPVVDPGEEVRFSVELCKIKNLPGLYIVDIRRMRGNVWAYKFLYHTLLDTLNLSGKGGYMTQPSHQQQQPQQQPQQQQSQQQIQQQIQHNVSSASSSSSSRKPHNVNRNSCASSGGSSMLEDVKEEED